MDGDQPVEWLLEGGFAERDADISPDGQWIAYASDESGQPEIHVRPFPNVNEGRWRLSPTGGRTPTWSPDGRELFYRGLQDDPMMVVPVDTEPTFSYGSPVVLFDGRAFLGAEGVGRRAFDISADGQRFLMIRRSDTDTTLAANEIILVQNWTEELK